MWLPDDAVMLPVCPGKRAGQTPRPVLRKGLTGVVASIAPPSPTAVKVPATQATVARRPEQPAPKPAQLSPRATGASEAETAAVGHAATLTAEPVKPLPSGLEAPAAARLAMAAAQPPRPVAEAAPAEPATALIGQAHGGSDAPAGGAPPAAVPAVPHAPGGSAGASPAGLPAAAQQEQPQQMERPAEAVAAAPSAPEVPKPPPSSQAGVHVASPTQSGRAAPQPAARAAACAPEPQPGWQLAPGRPAEGKRAATSGAQQSQPAHMSVPGTAPETAAPYAAPYERDGAGLAALLAELRAALAAPGGASAVPPFIADPQVRRPPHAAQPASCVRPARSQL